MALVKLNEKDIEQAFIGKPYNEERFSELFNKSNTLFCGLCDIKLKWKLDITPALYLGWEQRSIDFRIQVWRSNGVISNCNIIKRKDSYSGLYVRESCRELTPTQQELRLFKRILEYITT